VTRSSRFAVGHTADYLTLYKNYCFKIQISENQIKSAELSKEDCGSKRAVLPIMMMMMMMVKPMLLIGFILSLN
jgi:hypothetical protein